MATIEITSQSHRYVVCSADARGTWRRGSLPQREGGLSVEKSGQDRDDARKKRQQQHEADHDDEVGQRHPCDIAEPVIRQALDDEQVEAAHSMCTRISACSIITGEQIEAIFAAIRHALIAID